MSLFRSTNEKCEYPFPHTFDFPIVHNSPDVFHSHSFIYNTSEDLSPPPFLPITLPYLKDYSTAKHQ